MVCRARRDDTVMVRAGRTPTGRWYVGRGTGRGVWWCRGSDCANGLGVANVARAMRGRADPSDIAALRAIASQ